MSEVKLLAGETQKNESSKAIQACNDYLRMGAGRSLADLHRQYTSVHASTPLEPPTRLYDTLKTWSSRYEWASRAEQWDANIEERKTMEYNLAMKNGLAFDYERVNSLKTLALFLEEQIYEQGVDGEFHNVWLPDVKSIDGVAYDIERFNAGIFQQFRGTLDDLAKETGGRIVKQEITGAEGTPLIPQRAEAALEKIYGDTD